MRPDQVEEEVKRLIAFIDRMYSIFGLTYDIELSTRPDDFMGEIATWDACEKALGDACVAAGKTFRINAGDGAFYGPKLDFHIRDSLGRVWQCGTIQMDMNLPERFDCTYVDSEGKKVRPVMLHRVIYGSIERFIGILIEHYGGHFPMWLAPKQIEIIPVLAEKHGAYAHEVCEALKAKGVKLAFVTLHVGLGTFRPVKEDEITDHVMHSEFYVMDEETAKLINETRDAGGDIWAVGTTATRTLETIADETGHVRAQSGWTAIFIYPGYRFKAVDHLITNFHLPESTLMMLISAFASREMVMNAYQEAIKEEYRFFSFGDSMMLY